jgi:hypothetical protein
VEYYQAVSKAKNFFKFMGENDERFAFVFQIADDAKGLNNSRPVKIGEWLIHDYRATAHSEYTRNGKTAFFPAGKPPWGKQPLFGKAQCGKRFIRAGSRVGGGEAEVLRPENGIFDDGFPHYLRIGILKHQPQFPAQGFFGLTPPAPVLSAVQGSPPEKYVSAAWFKQGGNYPH